MPINDVLAGIAVADFDAALDWYERLFDRPPDRRPMDGLAEWDFSGTGSVQLINDDGRAGSSLVTVGVEDLAGHVAALAERGIGSEGIDDTTSEVVLFAAVTDPEGNTITHVEQRSGQ